MVLLDVGMGCDNQVDHGSEPQSEADWEAFDAFQ